MHTKNVKMVKSFFPLEPSTRWLGDGRKKKMISAILAKVKGLQSQKYKKMTKKAYLDADLRVGSHFGSLRGQNGSKLEKAFFPRNLTLLA